MNSIPSSIIAVLTDSTVFTGILAILATFVICLSTARWGELSPQTELLAMFSQFLLSWVVYSLFLIPITIRVWNECLRIAGLGHRRIRFALRFVASSSEVVDSEVVDGSPAI
ncbi:hypothetical protein B0H13DRAFT_2346490 [Mycena leptocephala]|nr:hypothetical protein B0H13DRAFT_2346490 [Mycena leptocephala]